jgi:hypothetical protein
MRSLEDLDPAYERVDEYYRARLATKGDVYGWGPLPSEDQITARLLANPSATGLPSRIGSVEIIIERVNLPDVL